MRSRTAQRTRDSLLSDFSQALSDAEGLLKQAARESGDKAAALREEVEAKLLSARRRIADMQDDAVEGAKAAARATDNYVRDNPWQAIGLAGAIGLIVGVLISRRSD